jgi:hypothetical protein
MRDKTTGTGRASAGFAWDPKRKEVATAELSAGNFLCRFGGNPLMHSGPDGRRLASIEALYRRERGGKRA